MQSRDFNAEQKYQRLLNYLNLPDEPFEDRSELIEMFAGAYAENRLLLLAGFPDISEGTIDELIMRILSDFLFKKKPVIEETQITALAKAAIDKASKN
jgi:hypothetical protein